MDAARQYSPNRRRALSGTRPSVRRRCSRHVCGHHVTRFVDPKGLKKAIQVRQSQILSWKQQLQERATAVGRKTLFGGRPVSSLVLRGDSGAGAGSAWIGTSPAVPVKNLDRETKEASGYQLMVWSNSYSGARCNEYVFLRNAACR